ncbi:MAG TPA: HD domain-containing phosphohydrolase [Gemmatimonadales bacterium]|nr:HD domain-containing phosphohydrolase [Gemmatimonadales bacterium]
MIESLLPDQPPAGGARCLVVDDDPQVRRALVRVVESQGLGCVEAGSADEALQVLGRVGEVPIIISDVHMPGLDGISFLADIRQRYPDTAVIMLTGVAQVDTAVACLKLGALDYITKPFLIDEVRARVSKALEKRDLILQNRFYQKNLESRVRQQAQRLKEMFLEGVQTLAQALEAKDAYTRGHSMRVSRYAVKTAVLLGFTGDHLEDIRLGSELHDIGKIGTREAVLNKPGPLTPEEFQHITEHTVLGEQILAPLARENPVVLRIVRSHHERIDGRGFPDGLLGDRIPIEARIVAVADAFDAMTTSRAYRPSQSKEAAFEELRRAAGSQFDPRVVEAFLAAFEHVPTIPVNA